MDRLPSEVISRIAHFLASPGFSQQDVLSLAKVEKRCFAAAEKVLYHHVRINQDQDPENVRAYLTVKMSAVLT